MQKNLSALKIHDPELASSCMQHLAEMANVTPPFVCKNLLTQNTFFFKYQL